jgi:hypothetical protein
MKYLCFSQVNTVSIDYRCEYGRFLPSVGFVTNLNPPAVKARLEMGQEHEEALILIHLGARKPLGIFKFTKK